MPCHHIGNMIICTSPSFRLRLENGDHVFMSWHRYSGPEFFYDKKETRWIDKWWENKLITNALDWFIARGKRA